MSTIQDPPPPVVCTLGAKDLAERTLEWTDLASLAVTTELIDGGVASTYPLELRAAIEDLTEREISCCGSWLETETTVTARAVRLELTTTNPDGLPVIRSMSGFDPSPSSE